MTGSLLGALLSETRTEVGERRALLTEHELAERAAAAGPVRGFAAHLAAARADHRLAVIAELKQRSPSGGELVTGYQPAAMASAYDRAGATALSVLCQGSRFGGHPDHIVEVRGVSALPILRKDFVFDRYQVLEARAAGADAVLLIVDLVPATVLGELHREVVAGGMDALVEVHDEAGLDVALGLSPAMVGINHRNLATLAMDLSLTERLRPRIPAGTVVVAESGIRSQADARRMYAAGADAILVGESLLRSQDMRRLLDELQSHPA